MRTSSDRRRVALPGALLTAFAILTIAVVILKELPGELRLVAAAIDARQPLWTPPIQIITFLTSAAPALAITSFCALLELRRLGRTRYALWPLVVYFGHMASNIILRIAIGREIHNNIEYIPNLLPEISASFQRFSYPSGHAGSAVVAWGCLTIVAWRTRARTLVLVIAVLLIAGTSFGRVYLGVHWPSDVLGGLLLGSAWLTAVRSVTLLPSRI
ncbi:MAG: phosphatase PAP2 family protein [Chloroflexi bacterium]|nr:phosphatase PAP2 family protein [Chloroflexota bacterium]